VALALLAALMLNGCSFASDQQAEPPATGEISTPDWFSAYFTEPDNPATPRFRGGPDQKLAQAIDSARLSVDIAVMDLDLWSVRDALIAAQRRGVEVRMVVESDNLDGEEIQDILAAGVPVLGDRREGLMHDKFVVIDRAEVWTGSLNYTVSDAYRNNNNLLRVRSSRLAEDYTREFEEMFVDDRFGPGSPANTPYPLVPVGGGQIEVYFSPDDGVASHLVDLIHGARENVQFLAFSFTSDDLAEALLERYLTGVDITGVMESNQVESNTGSDYQHFRDAGMDVRLDGNPDQMHHKVIIIDGQIVVTGSYNFSRNAEEKNDENLLVIHSPEIAALYMEEFQSILSQAQK
jgi:phosphatidylserine/phosphatidylglycerophosphate/cardiolipin synthase-like enzyme